MTAVVSMLLVLVALLALAGWLLVEWLSDVEADDRLLDEVSASGRADKWDTLLTRLEKGDQ